MRARLLLIFGAIILLLIFAQRWRGSWSESSQDQNILCAAAAHRVDPALIKAVVWRESRFNPRARGSKGEIGLMQIMPDGAGVEWAEAQKVAFYTDSTLLDPARNIDCSSWYLSKLLKRYVSTDDPVPYALADYNGGRRNVLRWMTGAAATNSAQFIEQIGFPSTQQYVRAVMARRELYADWAKDASSDASARRE